MIKKLKGQLISLTKECNLFKDNKKQNDFIKKYENRITKELEKTLKGKKFGAFSTKSHKNNHETQSVHTADYLINPLQHKKLDLQKDKKARINRLQTEENIFFKA